jgi:hypothetical protein
MNNFAEALAAMHRLKTDGLVADYAIGGAMALVFWSEPIATFERLPQPPISTTRGYRSASSVPNT